MISIGWSSILRFPLFYLLSCHACQSLVGQCRSPCGGGAGLGRDRILADPAARWRLLGPGAGRAGGMAVGLRCPAVHAKYALSRARWPGRATGLNGHQVVAVEAGGLGTQTRGQDAAGLYCPEN